MRSQGYAYNKLGQYSLALECHKQSLLLSQEVGSPQLTATVLINLAFDYNKLKQYSQAINTYQQGLNIAKETKDLHLESYFFDYLGNIYQVLKQPQKGLEFYQESIRTAHEIGDREREALALSDFASLLVEQKQPELAIVFYKQSINLRESIRNELRVLPKDQQLSYTETVADTYRALADLLLKQNRVLEAQQVLDLLKVQELNDYLRNVRGNDQTKQGVVILQPETEILKRYDELQKTAVQLGQEYTQLQTKLREQGQLTPQEEKRLGQLDRLQDELNEQFNKFIIRKDVVALINQLSQQANQQNINLTDILKLTDLNAQRSKLQQLHAILLYPLILDDRLELIITTPDSPPLRRTVYVKREDLNRTIADFRSALEHRQDNVKIPAQELYTWLIKPLEPDLQQVVAKFGPEHPLTIIYAPDGQLRYIPLAALYDGNQWLVQRYRINNITARSLTNLDQDQSTSKPRILAGAFSDPSLTYPIPIGERSVNFHGLPFTKKEVKTLATIFPSTTQYFDKAFSLAALKPRFNAYNVIHLATHAAFVPGSPEKSFILFGDGTPATLRTIENWSLSDVDLVVLSACETGVGIKATSGTALKGDGEEILGLGYQFQRAGAKATIASLWEVDDGGTQALMDAFYAALKTGKMTKAEALQQAQIALITGDYKSLGQQRGGVNIEPLQGALPKQVIDRLNHPYYWAPFILIGNGL